MTNPVPLDRCIAHALARFGFGVNIALHGLVRLPHIAQFSAGMEKEFAATFLPGGLVYATGFLIAIGEAAIGLLLIVGWLLRPALVAGALLIILLLFGVCLLQKWDVASLQLTYLAFYAVLLATISNDRFSIDGWRRSPTPKGRAVQI